MTRLLLSSFRLHASSRIRPRRPASRRRAHPPSFHWEPAGDEAVHDDGVSSGTGDGWAFSSYRRHPAVEPHLRSYNLGSSDLDAEHCLILDRQEESVAVALLATARSFLRAQHPTPPELTPYELEEARRMIEETMATGWEEVRADPEAIRRAMAEQREAIQRMLAFLDRARQG